MNKAEPKRPRTIAVCVIEHQGKLLVQDGYDAIHDRHFGRPLGGSIEFGERSHETIIREFQEELGVEVSDLRYLVTLENIFTYQGTLGHEIVQVYCGRLVDEALYLQSELIDQEDNGLPITASWVPLAEFTSGRIPLYPDGLLDFLAR